MSAPFSIGQRPRESAAADLSVFTTWSKRSMRSIAAVSAVLNVLLLAGSIYMMLVYDIVLPGRNMPTLAGLLVIVTIAYLFQGLLEVTRARMLVHLGASADAAIGRHAYDAAVRMARTDPRGDSAEPLRDLERVRSFLSGNGPAALSDLPWVAVFLVFLFLLHPLLALTVGLGALILIVLAVVNDRVTSRSAAPIAGLALLRNQAADTARRHAELSHVLGMDQAMRTRFERSAVEYIDAQARLGGTASTLASIGRMFRMLLQSLVLTIGAVLVINDQATGGVIFASSILSSRALAPIEQAIANWRGFVYARQSWRRLSGTLGEGPQPARMTLPAPRERLDVVGLTVAPLGTERPAVRKVGFSIEAGTTLAIIGPSGGGKSTLLRAVAGILPPLSGRVQLDGASIDQWSADRLAPHLGYLPQTPELMAGTIAENIARFTPGASMAAIVRAAELAGVHDMILRLDQGYDTVIGANGLGLSSGQSQRIALARALFGDPFLVLLDEPNANLDVEGERALADAVRSVRARQGIVIVVAHRSSILACIDLVMILRDGEVQAMGARDAVLQPGTAYPRVVPNGAPPPPRVAAELSA